MALTINRELNRYVDQELRTLPVKGSTRIYKGSIVGLTGGYARGLVAGDDFAGIAYEEANNLSGSDGDTAVRVYTLGDFEHALTSAARANNGAPVYASDDETLTLAATNNSLVGRQVDVLSAGSIVLRIEPAHPVLSKKIRTKAGAANVTIGLPDLGGVIYITGTTSGNLNLPAAAAAGAGAHVTFVKLGASGTLTIDPDGSETIDGAASNNEMDAANDAISIVSDGTGWLITSKKIAA